MPNAEYSRFKDFKDHVLRPMSAPALDQAAPVRVFFSLGGAFSRARLDPETE